MSRKMQIGFAFIRAFWLRCLLRVLYGSSVCIGKDFLVHKGAVIHIADKGTLRFENAVRIEKNARVSVLKEGAVSLGKGVSVGANNMIVCHNHVSIGDNTILAPNVLIYDHDHVFSAENGVDKRQFKTAPVSIGKNCWIGANVTILRGTVIEDSCIVGAGSVLKGHYPKGSLIIQKKETEVKPII